MTRQDKNFCAAKYNERLTLSVFTTLKRHVLLFSRARKFHVKIGGKTKERLNLNPEVCLQRQHSFLNIPPPMGRLGLKVQHHAALRGPYSYSLEDTTFDQCDQGSGDLVMHFR